MNTNTNTEARTGKDKRSGAAQLGTSRPGSSNGEEKINLANNA